ncbi:hypothetical protein ACSVIJ_04815 [Pseudomonas sp. NCHU5208]|uniref:hypothetical protein n=1 Tax=unclassified Pseudomonas TaxID=196821 RepID=UPI003F990091
MKSRLIAPLLVALLTSGCGGESVELPKPLGEVESGLPFKLPGSLHRLASHPNPVPNTSPRTVWGFSDATWKPNGWSLWVAANVYSATKRPGDAKNWDSSWKKAESAKDRAEADGRFLNVINEFVRSNGVPVEINYLGYDMVPTSISGSWGSSGMFYSWSSGGCEFAFNRCVNNYFVSPVSRYSGGDSLAFKEWVSPFFNFNESKIGEWHKELFTKKGGDGDESSEFYDWWPTMVFLVNADGEVVRAWLPQTGNTASAGRVIAGMVEEIGVDDPIVNKERLLSQPTTYAYYGEYYIEKGVKRLVKSLNRISE